MADYIQATPRNEVLGTIADLLRKGKEKGGFVGEMLLGDSDKFVDDLSYGQGPLKGAGGIGGTTGLKNTGMVDAAMLPGAATLATLLRKAPQAAAKAAETVPDLSRRAFTGGGAAAAALGAVSPAALVKALKAAPAAAGKAAPEAVAVAAKAIPKIMSPASIEAAIGHLMHMGRGRVKLNPEQQKAMEQALKEFGEAHPNFDAGQFRETMGNLHGGRDLTKEERAFMDANGGPEKVMEMYMGGEKVPEGLIDAIGGDMFSYNVKAPSPQWQKIVDLTNEAYL